MKSLKIILVITAAIFALAACDDDDDVAPTVTSTGDNIAGTWAIACAPDSDDPADGVTSSVTFSGGGLSFTFNDWFGDTACSGTSSFTLTGSSSITFVGTKTASGVTVSTLDFTDTAENVTPNSDSAATSLNAFNAWGIINWASGVSQSVLGTDFDGTTEPTTGKDLIYIDTTASPNTLQFGDEGSTPDSSGYPTTLDTDVFTK